MPIPFFQQKNGLAGLLGSATFWAKLTNSLILYRGTGSPTFTRATIATVTDNEGVIRNCLSGEARFEGARRVYNQWTTSSATLANLANKSLTLVAGTYIFSMGAGTGTATFSGTGGATGTLAASASARTSVVKTVTAGTFVVTASVADLVDLQVEDITGRTDQTTPSEYVSVGVLSAPYHGANVDGVKYFDTTLTGAAIPASTLKGYLAEGARTNLCLQSQFASGWSADSGCTLTPNAATAPDGTQTAATFTGITNPNANISAGPLSGVSPANKTYTASLYVTGNGTFSMRLTNNVDQAFTSQKTASSTWTRVSFTTSSAFNATAGNLHMVLARYTGDTVTELTVWGAQIEEASFASTYIPTTTGSVVRNIDADTYATAGNFSDTAGTMYAEVSYSVWANVAGSIVGSATQGMMPLATNSGVKGYDGTNTVNGTAGTPSGTVKMAVAWTGSTMLVCGNGTAVVSGSYDGAWNLTTIGIGTGSFANIKNVRIWSRALSSSELQAVTR